MYKYGMRLRGFAPFCQPMNGLDHAEDGDSDYWNFLFYNRELTAKELIQYELDYLGEVDNG